MSKQDTKIDAMVMIAISQQYSTDVNNRFDSYSSNNTPHRAL